MRLTLSRWLTVCMTLGLGLAACGGGGGGGSGGNPTPPTYTIGGAVSGLADGESVVLADNGTDTLTVNGNDTFTFAKRVDQNGSYAVTVMTQPNGQNCAVTSGSGASATANVTAVAVVCTNRPQYAYVVNNGSNTVSQYAIDASGLLSPLNVASVATGNSPQSITVDPSRKYAYVTNLTDNTISQYVIQGDGTLAPNTPATVATGHGPWAVTVSPSGAWAYVANSADNTISQFSINTSGALVATAMTPVATGIEPWNITLSPNGKYVYVANHGNLPPGGMTISQYAVDAATGALTALNPATLLTAFPYPGGITVDPTSAYAYLSNINGNTISEYGIGTDGTLSSLNPASVATGTEPVFLAFDPTGRYAYEANYTVDVSSAQGTVSQYAVGTAGQLTPLAPATVLAGTGPGWSAFDPFGKYAYVVNLGNGTLPGTVSEYAIGSGGALTLIGTATAGLSAFMIATAY
jgi:6-phosphogluconolactonase (cycloisomerase 2 family)